MKYYNYEEKENKRMDLFIQYNTEYVSEEYIKMVMMIIKEKIKKNMKYEIIIIIIMELILFLLLLLLLLIWLFVKIEPKEKKMNWKKK